MATATCYCTKAECQALAAKIAVLEGRLASLESRFNAHTKQPIPEAHRYEPPKPPNMDEYCTTRECARIRQIAIEAKQKAIEVDLSLQGHKRDEIPKAHKYKPSVSVDVSGGANGNRIKFFTRVDVDGASGNDSAEFSLNPNLSVDFSLAYSNGSLKGFSKVCVLGACASDSATIGLPIGRGNDNPPPIRLPDVQLPNLPPIRTPSLPPIRLPDIRLPNLPPISISPTVNPRGVGGGGVTTPDRPIACNLSASFNRNTCVLRLTLTVDKCTKTVNVNMQCEDLKPLLRTIQSDLTFLKNQFSFTEPIVLGKSTEPDEEGNWYGYQREFQVLPVNLTEAFNVLSTQIERNHKDTVKGINLKGRIDEIPKPKKCDARKNPDTGEIVRNPDTGEIEREEYSFEEMGLDVPIPWIGRDVVLSYLGEKLLNYLLKYKEKSNDLSLNLLCDLDNSCQVLMPDPSTPLNTRGAYLLFTWVLKENPKANVYQTQSQLRNPIDPLRTLNNPIQQWNTYFEGVEKKIGTQWVTYWSKQSDRSPLVQGWFFDENEAINFFGQISRLTKDEPREERNPKFSKIENDTTNVVNSGKILILRKVCYGTYQTGNDDRNYFKAIHSWKNPNV